MPKNKRNAKNQLKRLGRSSALMVADAAGYGPQARLGYAVAAKGIKAGKAIYTLAGGSKKKKNKPKRNKPSSLAVPQRREKMFSQPSNGGVILSEPAMRYLKSFIDPFDASVKAVGIPRPGSMPSYKVTGFLRGVGVIGTAGFGFVAFSPTLVNDRACIIYSGSTYAQNFVPSIATDVVGQNAFSPAQLNMVNLPYNYSTLTTTASGATAGTIIEGRVVSASLRVYYTGTTLNQSGQYYGYVDPNFESVNGSSHLSTAAQTTGYTAADLGAKDATEIKGADRQGMYLVWVPSFNALTDYPANNAANWRKTFPYSNGLTQGPSADGIGVSTGVIAITGVSQQTFYYEAITHVEYTGPGVPQALLTPSATDTVGFDAIQMLLIRAQRRCASDARRTFKQCVMAEAMADGIRF